MQLPEVIVWFTNNWRDVFKTYFDFQKTLWTNWYKNIINLYKSVWSWLKGEGWTFEWTGLLEGFESTLKEMPNITKREMSGVEKVLSEELAANQAKLSAAAAGALQDHTLDTAALLAKANAEGRGVGTGILSL